jgi:hypothetical protein
MHVLHVSSAKTWRGGEQQLAYLLEELQQFDVQQSVFCVKGSKMEAHCREQSYPFQSYKKRFSANPFAAYQLRELCPADTSGHRACAR